MKGLAKKYKLFLVITLAVLVVGMTLFGIFGFNQAIDHKDSYEVRVSVEQNAGNSIAILESATEEYLAQKGIKSAEYSFQKMDDGKMLVYKFSTDVKLDEDALTAHIQAKLDADASVNNVNAKAEYSFVVGYDEFQIGNLLLGLGVGVVAVFLFSLIMEKLSGAVAVAGVSIASFVTYMALVALTRLPAYPAFGATAGLACVMASALAYSTVAKCKEEYKKVVASKPNAFEVIEKAMKTETKKYIIAIIAIALSAIAISVFFIEYAMIVGGQILLAGLTACALAYFGAPLLWASVKGNKKA